MKKLGLVSFIIIMMMVLGPALASAYYFWDPGQPFMPHENVLSLDNVYYYHYDEKSVHYNPGTGYSSWLGGNVSDHYSGVFYILPDVGDLSLGTVDVKVYYEYDIIKDGPHCSNFADGTSFSIGADSGVFAYEKVSGSSYLKSSIADGSPATFQLEIAGGPGPGKGYNFGGWGSPTFEPSLAEWNPTVIDPTQSGSARMYREISIQLLRVEIVEPLAVPEPSQIYAFGFSLACLCALQLQRRWVRRRINQSFLSSC